MKLTLKIVAIACGLTLAAASHGAPPAGAPADSTGVCKDGTYYTGAEKKGACKGHKGVKDWWGKEGEKQAGKEAKATAAPKAAESAPAAPAKSSGEKVAAAGGGAGKVWVNTQSKVYHCPSDKWYGKTKQGEYMSEADATAKGFRADHGKACK